MHRLGQDIWYGLRAFARAPGFTAIAILVLGVGIGANTSIFTIVDGLLLRPVSGHEGSLVGVYSHDRTTGDSYRPFSYPDYADIRDRSGVFDRLLAQTFTMVGTPAGDGTRRSLAAVVSSNYFETIGTPLAAGRTFTIDEEQPGARVPVVIASYSRWAQEQFDPAFVGKTIRLNAEDFTVVGITPEGFTGTMALVSAEVYLPLGMFDAVVSDRFKNNGRGFGDRSNAALVLAGRLKPGLTEPVVSEQLEALSRQLEAAYPSENHDQLLTASLLPRLSGSPAPQNNSALVAFAALLLGLSGTVLLIACLNIANMLLARGSVRRKELAVRLALGATRARVVRQLLTESVVLAAAGGALGLALSYWATRSLVVSLTSVLPFNLALSPKPDLAVLVATVAFAAVSTLAFGLGPALRLSRRDLVADLKDRGGQGASVGRFGARNLMVVGQVALSLATLTAGGIFGRTAIEASTGNPGYSPDRLLLATLNTTLAGLDEAHSRQAFGAVLARLRSMPGTEAVTLASTVPFGDSQEGERMERVGGTAHEPVRATAYRVIGADYFRTLGLRTLRGREFTRGEEESPSAARVAIVDEVFAREMFAGDDPMGQLIRIAPAPGDPESSRGEPLQIVGIAPPLKEEILDRTPVSHVYVPFGRHHRAGMNVTLRLASGADEAASLEAVRREIRSAEPRLPVLMLSTLDAFHSRSVDLWGLKAGARLFTLLGLVALLLAAVGVYGLKSYVVSQRTREFGIRMALGARPGDVLRLVLRDGAVLTGAGVAIGLPLAILVSFAFSKVFVEIGGFDGTVLMVSTLVLTAAATIAGAVPARRATRIEPLGAIRSE